MLFISVEKQGSSPRKLRGSVSCFSVLPYAPLDPLFAEMHCPPLPIHRLPLASWFTSASVSCRTAPTVFHFFAFVRPQDAAGNPADVFYYNIEVEEVDVLDSIHGQAETLKRDVRERTLLR